MKEKEVIKPLTLVVEKDLWEKFKIKIPRNITLNEALIELIKKEVDES